MNINDVNLDDATILYLCSTCYSNDLLNNIYNKIKNNKHIKYIITLKDFNKFIHILPNKKVITISCTWNSNTNCNIYSK
jgi:hypothetical protein